MAQIAVNKHKSLESMPKAVLDRVSAIIEAIRLRAFERFQRRNSGHGSDWEDWLQAEREVVWVPESEVIDTGKEIRAKIALPGFDAQDIEVSALPDALLLRADATHTHEGESGSVSFCEFSNKSLFRRLDLPALIDVNKVSASLDKGILQITAPKATTQQMAVGA